MKEKTGTYDGDRVLPTRGTLGEGRDRKRNVGKEKVGSSENAGDLARS